MKDEPKIVKMPIGLPDDKGGTKWYDAEVGLTKEFIESIVPSLPDVAVTKEKLKLYEDVINTASTFGDENSVMGRMELTFSSGRRKRVFRGHTVLIIAPDVFAEFTAKLQYLNELYGEKK